MRNRIRSKIDQRLRELAWLHVPAHPVRFRPRRRSPPRRRMTRLGSGLLLDPRTGRIQAFGHVEKFGGDTPMKRAGQPAEVAPCYVFLDRTTPRT